MQPLRRAAVLVLVLMLAGCSEPNYAEGLKQPATKGVPTVGPGSGETIAEHFHYTMQKNNPTVEFEDPSCPDVPSADPDDTVLCSIVVDGDKQTFKLTMGKMAGG